LPAARADLREAQAWYSAISPAPGARFVAALDDCVATIVAEPELFQELHRRARRAPVRGFPYGLIFRIDGEDIHLIACFHASRDPGVWQRR
jgi:plasmid stabilization system protein ParE